jgi:ribosome recycling factor
LAAFSENKQLNGQSAGRVNAGRLIMSSERVKPYEERMEKTITYLQSDLQTVRAGRANPHVLDKIRVDYYGTPTPIQQVANVSVPEARIIQIAPWEKKMIKEISRAINASDLGINPTNDGSTIRLVFPELTGERRKQLSKDVKKMGEDAKVALRNIRRDGNDAFKKLKKSEDVSEDVVTELQDELQKATEKYIKKIDKMIEEKTKEITTL